MELEKLFGLPAHPLLVHIPVVLIPLSGIIAIVFAFKPAWLDRYGLHLAVLSFIGAVGGILAAGSGEGLENIQRAAGESPSAAAEDHFELGETARTMGIVFFLVVLAIVAIRWYARRKGGTEGIWSKVNSKAGAIVMAVVLVLSAGAATYSISKAGHQGAKLVWENESNPESDGG
jgi:uncharacterized membrane protein